MATDIIPETYPGCTCSVHSSLRSTSTRRKYGEGTEQVHSRKGTEYRFIHFGVILLLIFGYKKLNKGKTSGSRVIFKNEDKRPIMIHKPHPGNIIKSYAMKQVLMKKGRNTAT
jgi:hypothetical protein